MSMRGFEPFRPFTRGAGGGGAYDAAYRAAVLSDSPTAYWRLGEASGTTAEDETGIYDGTYVASPTLGATGIFDGNSAVTFNGTSQAVDASASAILPTDGTGQFTIEAWVYNTATTGNRCIFAQYLSSPTANRFYFFLAGGSSTSTLKAFFGNGGGFESLDIAAGTFTNSAWHHVAITRNGAVLEMYIDGVAQGIAAFDLRPILNVGNMIGAITSLSVSYNANLIANFTGTMDEVAIYPTALSPERITAHYVAAGY